MKIITIDADTGNRVYSRKEVAVKCGVSTQTIRLWEKAGSIPVAERDENDYSYWNEEELLQIKEYAGKSVKERKTATKK